MKPTLFSDEQARKFVEEGWWVDRTLSDVWDDNARLYPDTVAFADSQASMTWHDINGYADKVSIVLGERGLGKDEMVLLMLPNVWEAYALRIALQRAGLIAVVAPTVLSQDALEEILRLSRPAAGFFAGQDAGAELARLCSKTMATEGYRFSAFGVRAPLELDGVEALGPMVDRVDDVSGARDRALGAFELDIVRTTSGSTGLPKLVHNPSAPRIYVGRHQVERMQMTPQSRWLSLLGPHSGLMVPAYYSAPLVGAASYLLPPFTGEVAVDRLWELQATHAGAVPTQLVRMLAAPQVVTGEFGREQSALHAVFCGGAVLPSVVRREFEEITGSCVMNVYGMTEGSIGMELMPDGDDVDEASRALVPYPGVHIDVRPTEGTEDEGIGEIRVAGPSLHSGYVGDDPMGDVYELDDDSRLWIRTGDLGYVDDAGALHVTGRLKEVVIRGGLNIWPAEIERRLIAHPNVREIACVPVPDPDLGERVCACVVIDGVAPAEFTLQTAQEFLDSTGLPKSHWPEFLYVMEELPLVTGQKVDRGKLRVTVADRFAVSPASN